MNKLGINFIDNKVIIDDRKIVSISSFFKKMEDLDNDKFFATYDEANDTFGIAYDNCYYKDVYFGQNIDPKIIKRLKNLAILRKMHKEEHDLTKVEESESINEAKWFYLDLLKKDKASLKNYLHNLFVDIRKSYGRTKHDFHDKIVIFGFVTVGFMILSLAVFCFSPVASAITASNLQTFIFCSVWGSSLVFPTFMFIKNQIKHRFERIKYYITGKRIKNSEIKEIEASLIKASELPKENDNNMELSDGILRVLNELTMKLECFDPIVRSPLTKELKEIFDDYVLLNDSDLSYLDKANKRREINYRISKLEQNIAILKPSIDNNKEREVTFLRERIDNLSNGAVESQKVFHKTI